MLLADIKNKIEEFYPLDMAAKWDNSGLQIGRDSKEISNIYVCVDPSLESIENAHKKGADLIVAHHPLIFGGIDSVTDKTCTGSRILKAMEYGISIYSSHTCFDAVSMTKLVEEKARVTFKENGGILDDDEGIGMVYELAEPMSIKELAESFKASFDLLSVKVFGCQSRMIQKAAIVPGSGKSLIKKALDKGCELMITGDVDHHSGLDANESGLCIMDCGHYGLEQVFIKGMAELLRKELDDVNVIEEETCLPYSII